jgi:hypothetical protein
MAGWEGYAASRHGIAQNWVWINSDSINNV